jgi:hypothetical protein
MENLAHAQTVRIAHFVGKFEKYINMALFHLLMRRKVLEEKIFRRFYVLNFN